MILEQLTNQTFKVNKNSNYISFRIFIMFFFLLSYFSKDMGVSFNVAHRCIQ